jgi:hypothetical protein
MVWHVDPAKCTQLNLRQAPVSGTVIAVLPQGTDVDRVAVAAGNPLWWQVEVTLNGQVIRGFVHSGYLATGPGGHIPLAFTGTIPEVHLPRNGATRTMGAKRANPLDETGMPVRNSASASALNTILNYLDPGKSTHVRYQPGGGKTYCNIYAYDYAQRCKTYVPRVWWTPAALAKIAQGNVPPVLYGNTVREMTANMLHDWFIDFGGIYGWSRIYDVDALQTDANSGRVCIIVAKRINLARSGHIVAVVPETPAVAAARSGGVVVRPVQSQAGAVNFKAKVPGNRWWADTARFQSFGFWRHT